MGRESSTLFVWLHLHKDSIDIAVADAPRDAEIRHIGSIKGDLASLDKSLRKPVCRSQPLLVVSKAGPCRFVIQRQLHAQSLHCKVVAPSNLARLSGEHIKTDRRDAMLQARLALGRPARAERALCRGRVPTRPGGAREGAVREHRNGRRFSKALLRDGIPYAGKCPWAAAHLRWLPNNRGAGH